MTSDDYPCFRRKINRLMWGAFFCGIGFATGLWVLGFGIWVWLRAL